MQLANADHRRRRLTAATMPPANFLRLDTASGGSNRAGRQGTVRRAVPIVVLTATAAADPQIRGNG